MTRSPKTSATAHAPGAEVALPRPDSPRAGETAGVPGALPPGTGTPATAPGPGPGSRSPGPSEGDGEGLRGRDFTDAVRRAQSAARAAQRNRRGKRAPKATGPGMIRRLPSEPPGGAA